MLLEIRRPGSACPLFLSSVRSKTRPKIQNSKILKPKTQNPAPGPSQEELPTFSDIYQTVKPLSKHDVQSFLTSIAPVCSAQFNSEVASNMFYRKCRFLLLQEYFSGVVAL